MVEKSVNISRETDRPEVQRSTDVASYQWYHHTSMMSSVGEKWRLSRMLNYLSCIKVTEAVREK